MNNFESAEIGSLWEFNSRFLRNFIHWSGHVIIFGSADDGKGISLANADSVVPDTPIIKLSNPLNFAMDTFSTGQIYGYKILASTRPLLSQTDPSVTSTNNQEVNLKIGFLAKESIGLLTSLVK